MQVDRKLGFWMCVALVVGNMIGSGIFLLPAQLGPLGLNSLFGWLATAAGALVLAWIFSSLSRAFPEAEGPQAYVRMAFGDLAAFIVAWAYWISIWVGNAAIVTGAVSYLGTLIPPLGSSLPLQMTAMLAVMWILTAVNSMGVRVAGGFQVVTTVLKLIPLVAISLAGFVLFATNDLRLEWQHVSSIPISAAAITASATLTLWPLLGFESASIAAQRVVDPARNIPRATLIGTLVVAVIYVISCTTVILMLPSLALAASKAPYADAAGLVWGSWAAQGVAVLVVISTIGSLNGWIMLQGELPLQLARRGQFPAVFGRLSSRQTPVLGLCISSALVSILALMNYGRSLVEIFSKMLLLSTTATLVLYLACSIAVLVLSRKRGLGSESNRVAWLALAGVFGGAYALWAIYGAGQEAVLWGLGLLIAGIPVYFLMRHGRAVAAERDRA
jgi:APA family basic amino acid/polyamine antiporter